MSQRDFRQILLTYGNPATSPLTGEQRRAFLNWLLVECLGEYAYREHFKKAFSSSGSPFEMKAEASWLCDNPVISVGDLADAIFHACTDTAALLNYAGDESFL